MKILIVLLFLMSLPVAACDLEPYPFVRVAAGWTGNFSSGEKDPIDYYGLAAQIELGARMPLNKNWSLDAKYGHDSWWFEDADGNDARDHLNIGLEYQFR